MVLCVDPPGAAACTSTDSTPPVVESGFGASEAALPGRRLASRDGRSRTILVSWGAQDGAGSGVAHYSVEVSDVADGAGASQAEPEWRTLRDKVTSNGLHFRGESGDAHRFRITATDRALNSASIVTDPVLIPVDDRDRGILHLSRGWKRTRAANAWGRTVVRASRRGATGRMRFRGTQVALIGRRLARGGRLRVTLDGRSRTLRVRGRSGHRERPLGEPEAEARLALAAAPLARRRPGGARRGGAVAMSVRAMILGGLVAMALAAPPAAGAAAPKVQQLVVFRSGAALQKTVGTRHASVVVRRQRCAVGDATALAALVRSKPGRLRLRDFGACSSRPRDAAGLLVTGIGPDRNRGQRGWVYKVGRRAATAGAGDMSGPFGRGRLRRGQRVTWFYCVRAGECQRTLEVRAAPASGGVVATVRGYDDAGDGVPVEGASVSAGGVTGLTGADGRVQLTLPPGAHRLVARRDGLVRSFSERVEVP